LSQDVRIRAPAMHRPSDVTVRSSSPRIEATHRRGWPSDACGKHHVANVADHLVVWRVTESPVMNEPIGHMAGSCPSSDGLRRMPMSHVAMKVLVANHLKKRNLAVVRHVWVGPKAADGRFQPLDVRRLPRTTEKLVSCRNPHRSSAAAVLR